MRTCSKQTRTLQRPCNEYDTAASVSQGINPSFEGFGRHVREQARRGSQISSSNTLEPGSGEGEEHEELKRDGDKGGEDEQFANRESSGCGASRRRVTHSEEQEDEDDIRSEGDD